LTSSIGLWASHPCRQNPAIRINIISMSVGALLIFHALRLRRFQPAFFMAMTVSVILLLIAAVSYLTNAYGLRQEHSMAAQLQTARAPAGTRPTVSPPVLPAFSASVVLEAIERGSTSAQVTVDDFTFVLEDSAGVPYRRYRASMSMAGRYPQVRQALARILGQLPYGALDAIKCTRADIVEVDVVCSVTISTFYRRTQS
jgi:hypothetical protein